MEAHASSPTGKIIFPTNMLAREITCTYTLIVWCICLFSHSLTQDLRMVCPQQLQLSSAPWILELMSSTTPASAQPAHASEASTSAPWSVALSSITLAPRSMTPSKGSKNENSFFRGPNMIFFFEKRAKKQKVRPGSLQHSHSHDYLLNLDDPFLKKQI